MNVWRRYPRFVELELESRFRSVEVDREVKRSNKGEKRNAQREPPDFTITAGKKQQQDGARQRSEGDQTEDDGVKIVDVHCARTPSQTMQQITAAAPAATHPA